MWHYEQTYETVHVSFICFCFLSWGSPLSLCSLSSPGCQISIHYKHWIFPLIWIISYTSFCPQWCDGETGWYFAMETCTGSDVGVSQWRWCGLDLLSYWASSHFLWAVYPPPILWMGLMLHPSSVHLFFSFSTSLIWNNFTTIHAKLFLVIYSVSYLKHTPHFAKNNLTDLFKALFFTIGIWFWCFYCKFNKCITSMAK